MSRRTACTADEESVPARSLGSDEGSTPSSSSAFSAAIHAATARAAEGKQEASRADGTSGPRCRCAEAVASMHRAVRRCQIAKAALTAQLRARQQLGLDLVQSSISSGSVGFSHARSVKGADGGTTVEHETH